MKNLSGMHYIANGKVQGVFYRKFCQTEALKLNLTGWAKNLKDGTVEITVYGEEAAIAAYEKKLQKGPMFAKVTQLTKESVSFESHEGFRTF